MAWLLSVLEVVWSSYIYRLLSARRAERAIAGLWAMRGSKRSHKGGGQVRPLTHVGNPRGVWEVREARASGPTYLGTLRDMGLTESQEASGVSLRLNSGDGLPPLPKKCHPEPSLEALRRSERLKNVDKSDAIPLPIFH